jgi:ABC-type multidrug transport system fused ATPase/permease subunit
VNLPIRGEAVRYPFDRWSVRFNAVPLRVLADGTKQEIAADDPRGQVAIQVDNRIPRMRMEGQTFAGRVPEGAAPIASLGVELDFERPLYLRIVTVLLVVLIGAASAYAVFLRPLSELIINAGALVLGVWGIRAVLLGTELTFMTGVDLALMGVILFLLTMLTLRTLWGLEARSRVRPLRNVVRRWQGMHD